jgi:hypothetical protein
MVCDVEVSDSLLLQNLHGKRVAGVDVLSKLDFAEIALVVEVESVRERMEAKGREIEGEMRKRAGKRTEEKRGRGRQAPEKKIIKVQTKKNCIGAGIGKGGRARRCC